MPEQKPKVKTVKVKLLRPHKHAGEQHAVGAEIELPEKKAAFAIRAKSAEKV